MMNRVFRTFTVLGALALASPGFAQAPRDGRLLVTVVDQTGAVIPGATVTAHNVDTGQARNSVTGADGSYRLSALPVGDYEVRVEQQGFSSEVRSGLTLAVSYCRKPKRSGDAACR